MENTANYKLEITAAQFESVESGQITFEQYEDLCKILSGDFVAVPKQEKEKL